MRALRDIFQSVRSADLARVDEGLRDCPSLARKDGLLLLALSPSPSLGPLGAVMNRPTEAERLPVVDLLLAHGADPNARDALGVPALHLAVQKGWRAIADLLTAYGAEVNAKDPSGDTPLFRAAAQGSEAMTELLLDRGADPNAENRAGETPLHRAVRRRRLSLVPILLSHDAATEVADRRGLTPLQVAHDDDVETVGDIFSRFEGVRRFIGSFSLAAGGTGEQTPSPDPLAVGPVRRSNGYFEAVGA